MKLERVCANCQKSLGLKPSANESHGICFRHYRETLLTFKSELEVNNLLLNKDISTFCADLELNNK